MRVYDGIGLNSFFGDAWYVGPTTYLRPQPAFIALSSPISIAAVLMNSGRIRSMRASSAYPKRASWLVTISSATTSRCCADSTVGIRHRLALSLIR